jgi:large subunit ribosomal protein L4
MPRKMRQAALRSALSIKLSEADVVVVDDLMVPEVKTQLMIEAMDALVGDDSALVLIPEKTEQYEQIVLSSNNIPDVKTLSAGYLNIRDLLKYKKLVMPVAALDRIKAYLG